MTKIKQALKGRKPTAAQVAGCIGEVGHGILQMIRSKVPPGVGVCFHNLRKIVGFNLNVVQLLM